MTKTEERDSTSFGQTLQTSRVIPDTVGDAVAVGTLNPLNYAAFGARIVVTGQRIAKVYELPAHYAATGASWTAVPPIAADRDGAMTDDFALEARQQAGPLELRLKRTGAKSVITAALQIYVRADGDYATFTPATATTVAAAVSGTFPTGHVTQDTFAALLADWRVAPDGGRGSATVTAAQVTAATQLILRVTNSTPLTAHNIDAPVFLKAPPMIAGKVPRLRLRGVVGTNDVAPGCNITLSLYAFTASGGSGNQDATLGAKLTAADLVFASAGLTVHDFFEAEGPDIAAPADGKYLAVVTFSAAMATDAAVSVRVVPEWARP